MGEETLIQGQSSTYSADFETNLVDVIITWTMNGEVICENCSEVTISPNEVSELCVLLEYGDACLLEDCLLIEINERTKLHIPNAFSPNGDNSNDFFTINANNPNVFVEEIMILDRWGQFVYNQKGFNLGEESYYWDGTANGEPCVEGVYVYIISYRDEENNMKKITGDLTLVR